MKEKPYHDSWKANIVRMTNPSLFRFSHIQPSIDPYQFKDQFPILYSIHPIILLTLSHFLDYFNLLFRLFIQMNWFNWRVMNANQWSILISSLVEVVLWVFHCGTICWQWVVLIIDLGFVWIIVPFVPYRHPILLMIMW